MRRTPRCPVGLGERCEDSRELTASRVVECP
jgi:hypothetical protein